MVFEVEVRVYAGRGGGVFAPATQRPGMSADTVAVTGGNGEVGRAVLAHLADRGYRTVNLNRGSRAEAVADAYVTTDLLDAGDVYAGLAVADPDAVVHLGMIPTPEDHLGHVTFESNVMTTYHVLDAAGALGVETAVLASSLSAMGAGFEDDPVDARYLPVDEAHPLTPSNPYGLGKQVLEVVADGFARRDRPPRTVASLRFPWVVSDDAARETFLGRDRSLAGIRDAGVFHKARNTLFAYLHVDDATAVVERAATADFDGHERFWAVADDTTTTTPTEEVVAEVYPDADVREPLSGRESLVSTAKARDQLGWQPDVSWRDLE